jgi:hypothetical protein
MKKALEPSKVSTTEPFYSFHAFLFPFEWKPVDPKNQLLEDQLDLQLITQCLESRGSKWAKQPSWLKTSKIAQFNEVNYFYDFVRPVIYGGPKSPFQIYYSYKLPPKPEYKIILKNGKSYQLDIDDIGVSFYNTGVGILSIHCLNRSIDQSAPQDILAINQYGRRIYPPYYGVDSDLIGQQKFFDDDNWARGLEGTQFGELALSLSFNSDGVNWLPIEDFSYWKSAPSLDQPPTIIKNLLPASLGNRASISPALDDRMFVVSWYGNNEFAAQLRNLDTPSDARDLWYKYLFVDTATKTCQNEKMTAKLLEEHTYSRWTDYDTHYGVSRYSFVCLSGTFSTLKSNFAAFIVAHSQTIYFKLSELTLLQRACVLRYSDEVTQISDLKNKNERQIAKRVGSLYRQYIRFINQIYFREVTAQEQGIELYDLLQIHMRLKEQVSSLDREITELNSYVSLLEESERNSKLDMLTFIGAFFVIPSFIVGMLQLMSFQTDNKFPPPTTGDITLTIATAGLNGILVLTAIRSSGWKRWLLLAVSLAITVSAIVLLPQWLFH